MRIAAIYDIHGNLSALEAVLSEIDNIGADRIVVGGDVIPGPMPSETLSALFAVKRPIEFIHGNGEIAILQQVDGDEVTSVPPQVRPIIEWTAQQLSRNQLDQLRSWPKTFRLESESLGRILFCHATPRNENEIFTKLTSVDRLEPIFSAIDADIVVCGHTHMQFDRTVGPVRIVNAGSVGMPFGESGAHWLLLERDIQFRQTSYNFEQAADRIRGSNYPQAEQFAANNILTVPAEAQMLEIFERSAAKS